MNVITKLNHFYSERSKLVYRIIEVYYRIYNQLCGVHPYQNLLHSQWLSVKDIYRDLKKILPNLNGDLLDVGCMNKPYKPWCVNVDSHIGIDVTSSEYVDFVIKEGKSWPFEDGKFQSLICTQVIQLTKDVSHTINEVYRVLSRDGIAVISAPFCYSEMSIKQHNGVYKDYWRYGYYGMKELVSSRFDIIKISRQGKFGSTAGQLFLNFLQETMARNTYSHLLFVMLFPIWIPFCFLVNLFGSALDIFDRTDNYYHNVIIVAKKR